MTTCGPDAPSLVSHTGRTLDGHPLAFNHCPADTLKPWFCWFSLTVGEVPSGQRVSDGIFNDLATIRILFGGRWVITKPEGDIVIDAGDSGAALFFGPHSTILPVSVEGRFTVMTVQLAAGASYALGGPDLAGIVDSVIDHDELAGHGRLASRFAPNMTPEQFLAVTEHELGKFLSRNNSPRPDPLTTAFERCTLANPAIQITAFAEEHGVTTRTVERVIRRDFGLSPKQVLRRARALDMAALLMGVAIERQEAELRLRYFDQSHLIREMREFFGRTPSELRERPHPLLRLNLETRQARRVEALEMLPPGTIEPWRDPDAQPDLSRTVS